jgi:hypothetical protein
MTTSPTDELLVIDAVRTAVALSANYCFSRVATETWGQLNPLKFSKTL